MLSRKQVAFLKDFNTEFDFLEGTIRSGKTHVARDKFILRVADSNETQFVIAGEESTTVERNIIDCENGLLKTYGEYMEYRTNNIGGKHILFNSPNGMKKIYIIGYYDKRKWKKILGSTIGGFLIDEVTVSSMDFFKEAIGRMATVDNPFMICTGNPDNPDLDIYHQYLNRCRPLPEFDIPQEIMHELETAQAKDNWRYWHFNFRDNPIMTEDKINRVLEIHPEHSTYYKTKIIGLRGKMEGAVYKTFDRQRHTIDITEYNYDRVTVGVDYGETDATTAVATGFRKVFSEIEAFAGYYHKNGESSVDYDIVGYVEQVGKFIKKVQEMTGKTIEVFVDSANKSFRVLLTKYIAENRIQAIVKPVNKRKENPNSKKAIEERIACTNMMLNKGILKIDKSCRHLISALSSAVRGKDGQRLDDGSTNIDSLDGFEYSFKPYMRHIMNNLNTHISR